MLAGVLDAIRGTAAAGPAAGSAVARTLPADIAFVLGLAVCVGTVLAWVGLLNLWSAARPLYAASWAGYLLLVALRAPGVSSPVVQAAELGMGLAGGMILGLIYFSDLRAQFRTIGRVAHDNLPARRSSGSPFRGAEPTRRDSR